MPIHIPPSKSSDLFSLPPPNIYLFLVTTNRCEVMPLRGLDLHFSKADDSEHIFSPFLVCLRAAFKDDHLSPQVLCSHLNQVAIFFFLSEETILSTLHLSQSCLCVCKLASELSAVSHGSGFIQVLCCLHSFGLVTGKLLCSFCSVFLWLSVSRVTLRWCLYTWKALSFPLSWLFPLLSIGFLGLI